MNPYEVLGLDTEATINQIKRAYRKASRIAHPDMDGGSKEAFEEVKLAFDVLSSPERRHYYDRTGKVTEPVVTDKRVKDTIAQMITSIISDINEDQRTNVLNKLLMTFQKVKGDIQHNQRLTEAEIIRAKRLRKSFYPLEDGSEDFIGEVIDRRIENLKGDMQRHEDALEMNEAVVKYLKTYGFRTESPQEGQYRDDSASSGFSLRTRSRYLRDFTGQ